MRDRGTQERQQTGGGATQTHRMREPHQEGQGRAQQTRRRGTARRERLPEWSGWQSGHMGGSDNKGDGLASQPRRYRVLGQPLLNQHQVGGVSRSPDGLFAQQEREPIRGRPAVRGKRTYGGRPRECVEKQGTWASHTQKHSEAGYGRPVDRGAWTAKTVKRPRQQPAHPQYANHWVPLTRKPHTMPHSAQPQHTNYWAPRTRKRHQQEHRPQRPTESSDPTQHAKVRTGDCPGPRKGATTRRNVTQGGAPAWNTTPWERCYLDHLPPFSLLMHPCPKPKAPASLFTPPPPWGCLGLCCKWLQPYCSPHTRALSPGHPPHYTLRPSLQAFVDCAECLCERREPPPFLSTDLNVVEPAGRIGGQCVELIPLEDGITIKGIDPVLPFHGFAQPMFEVESFGNFRCRSFSRSPTGLARIPPGDAGWSDGLCRAQWP